MKIYSCKDQEKTMETIRRAISLGVMDIRIVDCSGDSVSFSIHMDMSCILDDEEQKYVTEFAECEKSWFNHHAPWNPEFLGAQPARAGQDY
jgi:hypothetical protein